MREFIKNRAPVTIIVDGVTHENMLLSELTASGTATFVKLKVPLPSIRSILKDIEAEMISSEARFGGYYSAHHGWGVLQEELDELWDHIKSNQKTRDLDAMRKEAIQVASCAARIISMIDEGRGRV